MQARRWTRLPGGGFIHSFNGAHSLFVDTIRSLRALALGHALGQRLMEEQDASLYHLSNEQAEEVRRRRQDFREGQERYATDEEMAALWKKCGL